MQNAIRIYLRASSRISICMFMYVSALNMSILASLHRRKTEELPRPISEVLYCRLPGSHSLPTLIGAIRRRAYPSEGDTDQDMRAACRLRALAITDAESE